MHQKLAGVVPIAPTTFDDSGELDISSQRRAIDFLVDAGASAICILALFSEQSALTDGERDLLTDVIVDHVAGRVPVVVTTSHYSARIAAMKARGAEASGASMVMLTPPYHGVTMRPSPDGVLDYFRTVAEATNLPIMIQDNPVSGTTLSARFLAEIAKEIPNVRYFKIEDEIPAIKIRELVGLAGEWVHGPFDGQESVTLIPDLDAGATGTVPGGTIPDVLARVVNLHASGLRNDAMELYDRWLPLINYENRLCGLRATKVLMKEGGVISSEATRAPLPPLDASVRGGLLEIARRLDAMVLTWAR